MIPEDGSVNHQKKCSELEISIGCNLIKQDQTVKFLGFFLDFKNYCEYISNTLNTLVYMLGNFRTVQHLIAIYLTQEE